MKGMQTQRDYISEDMDLFNASTSFIEGDGYKESVNENTKKVIKEGIDSELSDYQKDVIKDMVQADFECGMPMDYDSALRGFYDDEDFEGVEDAAASYYVELIEMGPAGIMDEIDDGWSDEYRDQYSFRESKMSVRSKIAESKKNKRKITEKEWNKFFSLKEDVNLPELEKLALKINKTRPSKEKINDMIEDYCNSKEGKENGIPFDKAKSEIKKFLKGKISDGDLKKLTENKVAMAVADVLYHLVDEEYISQTKCDRFLDLLARGQVDEIDVCWLYDATDSYVDPQKLADIVNSYFQTVWAENRKTSRKKVRESFDNPIDQIVMDYACFHTDDIANDLGDDMETMAKGAAKELKANGFTAEEVKAHFDADGYYHSDTEEVEGHGTWDWDFANSVIKYLKESKKNKKRVKENANPDDMYYVVLNSNCAIDEFGNPEDWEACEKFDRETFPAFEEFARSIGMDHECIETGGPESGPKCEATGIFHGTVDQIRQLVDAGYDIDVYENWNPNAYDEIMNGADESNYEFGEYGEPLELTGKIYDVNALVYDANEPLSESKKLREMNIGNMVTLVAFKKDDEEKKAILDGMGNTITVAYEEGDEEAANKAKQELLDKVRKARVVGALKCREFDDKKDKAGGSDIVKKNKK